MQNKLSPVILDPMLAPREKIVYCVLYLRADEETHSCTLSVHEIAQAANCSIRVVQRVLSDLERSKYIERTENFEGGAQKPSTYHLLRT